MIDIDEKVAIDEDGNEYKLTANEVRLVKQVLKLDKLWKIAGKRFILYNGNQLRVFRDDGSYFRNQTIMDLLNIFGDGGDGGDNWEESEHAREVRS